MDINFTKKDIIMLRKTNVWKMKNSSIIFLIFKVKVSMF